MDPDLALPHHDGSPAFTSTTPGAPVAAPGLGDTVRLRVEVPHAAQVDDVHLRTVGDGEPNFLVVERVARGPAHDVYEVDLEIVSRTQPYRFLLERPGGDAWLTQSGVVAREVPDTWDFRVIAGDPVPAWVADSVLYQVFPDRFARAGASDQWPEWAEPAAWDDPILPRGPESMRQLYGGDLPGIGAHVDHLVGLGVTGVYLNPIFPAPENHRYCASDFAHVDPFLGGDDALADLSATLHGAGMRLIGDLTLNHSGSTHPWFVAAQADPDSVEAGFYHFIEHPDRYHSWAGVPSLPKFDHRSAELRCRLYDGPDSVAARYLAAPFHLDGWRVDAANMVGRCGDVDLNHEVQRILLDTMRSVAPDSYLLAEHCHDATGDLQGSGWHGTMDYTGFSGPAWTWLCAPDRDVRLLGWPAPLPRRDAAAIAATIAGVRGQVPWRSVLHSLTLLGSHDTARWAWAAGDPDRRNVGFAWLFTFPGIPSLLYGDEIGLAGEDDERAREPMPWHAPQRWDRDLLTHLRGLIALRRGSVALRHGGLRWVHAEGDRLVYLREHPDERILVTLTRDAAPAVGLDAALLRAGAAEPLWDARPLAQQAGSLTLPATTGPSARVWRLHASG